MAQIEAVNSRGEKVNIPEHWLDHPVLGEGFHLPPSRGYKTTEADPAPAKAKASAKATHDAALNVAKEA